MASLKPLIQRPSPLQAAPSQEAPVQDNFMFVALTGKKDQSYTDKDTRKRLRAHVMHNFRGREVKVKSTQQNLEEDKHVPQQQRKVPASVGGQKLRFRLKEDGRLEESVPLRQWRREKGRRKGGDGEGEGEHRAENEKEKGSEKGQAPLIPSWESWTGQYFGDQSELQADFQLPSLLPDKQQYRTVTENYFDTEASRNFWDDPSVDYSLLPLTSTALAAMPLPTSPLLPFGKSRLDPLNVLPFRLSRRDEEFIDRFQNWETDSWCPVNGRGVWFAAALGDELLFHATMYHWGMHFVRTNTDFHVRNPEILAHKLASFRMINSRLNQSTVANSTIAAVAAITNIEISFGSREEAQKHMTGLETLVGMKGGIGMLTGAIDGVLQRFIAWNDLNYAELFGSQLRFTRDCDFLNEPDTSQAGTPCFQSTLPGTEYSPQVVRDSLQGSVIRLLHEIRSVCHEVNSRPSRTLPENQKIHRSDSLHAIERRLRLLTVTPRSADLHQPPSTRIWRATALAGLIYVHHMLRALPLVYRQFNSLSRDLQTALSLTLTSDAWKNTPEILVWALTVGTIISQGRMEHAWYVERLAGACQDVRYTDWERYRGKMASFLWVGRLDEGRYGRVWREVEILL